MRNAWRAQFMLSRAKGNPVKPFHPYDDGCIIGEFLSTRLCQECEHKVMHNDGFDEFYYCSIFASTYVEKTRQMKEVRFSLILQAYDLTIFFLSYTNFKQH